MLRALGWGQGLERFHVDNLQRLWINKLVALEEPLTEYAATITGQETFRLKHGFRLVGGVSAGFQ